MKDKFFSVSYFSIFIVILLIKVNLSLLFPLTGDEAYFIQWGKDLSAGYYDHTPMVGWVNYLMGFIWDDFRFYRVFSVIATLTAALVIFKVSADKARGALAAMIWWVSPASLLLIPMLNDSTLLFFVVVSYLFFDRWKNEQTKSNALLCGLMLGLAFLSKYLAVFVGIGYVVSVFYSHRFRWLSFSSFVFLGSLPSIIWNIVWNQQNCWNNIMFNLLNRQMTQSEGRPDLYALSVVGILTPWLCFAAIKKWSQFSLRAKGWLVLFMTPIILFGFMSLKRVIGLHWLVAFIVPFYILLSFLDERHLRRLLIYSAFFGVFVGSIMWFGLTKADTLVQRFIPDATQLEKNAYLASFYPKEVCAVLEELSPSDFQIGVTGYPPAAIFEHRCGLKLPILFATGVYGRQCDKRDDLSIFQGQNLSLYVDSGVAERYGGFFESFEVRSKILRGTTITMLLGRGFNFEKYRSDVLRPIAKSYYSPPNWLPQSRCYFLNRYFPDGLEAGLEDPSNDLVPSLEESDIPSKSQKTNQGEKTNRGYQGSEFPNKSGSNESN